MNRKLQKMSFCLMAAIAFIFAAADVHAATYYVNNQVSNSSDDNPGTSDAPWLTVQHAADMVRAGDSVIVKPGVYPESVKLSQTGTAALPIVFQGEPGTVLDGSGIECVYCSGFVNWAVNPDTGYEEFSLVDFITIDGFEIRNFERGVYAQPAVVDCADGANCLNLGGSGWVLKNNTIHDSYEGISIWSSNSPEDAYLIANNVLYNNTWTDIHTHRYSTVVRNIALSHTEEENIRSCTAYYLNGATHHVNNNTTMNGTYGIQIAYPGGAYKNNIIMNTVPRYWYTDEFGNDVTMGGWAFQNRLYTSEGYDLSMVNISYNNMFNVQGEVGAWEVQQELPASAVGNISVDPLFVNYTGDHTGDYHLTAASSCIDAGDPADPVPAGGGARIDIGAYEYLLSGVPGLIESKHSFYGRGLIDNRGIVVSLDAKLNAANAALLRGQENTAVNILRAFIRETRAQSGKHVNSSAADSMIADAEMILKSIEAAKRKPGKK